MVKLEHKTVWTDGNLEFDSDLDAMKYYINNNITPSESGDEFKKVEKFTIVRSE